MPPNTVYVGRPTKWGNPYRWQDHAHHPNPLQVVLALYRHYLAEHPELVETARHELAGKNLACWCDVAAPCHADVLLEVIT
jgi:hypothetical protein